MANDKMKKLMARLQKVDSVAKPITEDYDYEYVHTGNYLLNAQMSGTLFGGYPVGAAVQFAGDSDTGKTFFLLNAAREFQKEGHLVYWIDTEAAVHPETVRGFGIDPDYFMYTQVYGWANLRKTMSDILDEIEAFKKDDPDTKVVIFLDSMAALGTEKEIEDAKSGNTARDLTGASEAHKFFRLFQLRMSSMGISFPFTNRIYRGMGGYGDPRTLKFGDATKYPADYVGMLGTGKLKGDEDYEATEEEKKNKEETGVKIFVTPIKTRGVIKRKIAVQISFKHHMNPFVGLEDFIGWDICGVERGSLEKLKKSDEYDPSDPYIIETIDEDSGEVTEVNRFVPKKTAHNYICKHLDEKVPLRDLYTAKVFTPQVLKQIDEKAIKPHFKYSNYNEVRAKDNLDDA